MALPNWTIELLRRSLNEVAEKARQPETIEKLKAQASEILQDLPQTAARGLDAVMRGAESGRKSVQRWTRKHTQLSVPLINATGTLMTDHGTGVPLAPAILEVGREVGSGDALAGVVLYERLARLLDRILGASSDLSFAIVSSFDAAVASISTFSATRTIAVHRSNCVQIPSTHLHRTGLPLPAALSTIGVSIAGLQSTVMEVGSSNVTEPSDFDSVERACVVIADGGDQPIEAFDLSGRDASENAAIQIAVLPVATLHCVEGITCKVPSATEWLSKVDIVVMPGNGVAGGPPCGIIVGKRQWVQTITSSDAWATLQANPATVAMMTVALEMAESNDSLPVMKLMETSLENLKSRAERMAVRLSAQASIASCQVTADDAKLTSHGRWTLPSRQLCLRHATLSAKAWAEQLREDLPSVMVAGDNEASNEASNETSGGAGNDGECVKLDLRWIAPSEDSKLAEMVGGGEPKTESVTPSRPL